MSKIIFKICLAVFGVCLICAVPAFAEDICCQEEFPNLFFTQPFIKSDAVLDVQEALHLLGYYNGPLHGVFDQKTMMAIQEFQINNGLNPDGRVRYHVWLKLTGEMDKQAAKNELAPPSGQVSLVIDVFRRKIIVFDDDKPYAQFPVAVGKEETPSPIGNWTVVDKAANWGTGFGTRWLGLNVNWGIYGIHGTNKPWSIGTLASHGCFRMWNKDVETIYPWVKIGTPVTVIGNPFGYMYEGLPELKSGQHGSGIFYMQRKLSRLNFYRVKPDGLYGPTTAKAIAAMQKEYRLNPTGSVDDQLYKFLGMK